MKLRNTLMVATFLCAPVVAMAQPVSGPYVAGSLGGNYLTEVTGNVRETVPVAGGTNPYSQNGKIKSNGGMGALASVGYGFGNGVRVELEGSYLQQSTRLSHNTTDIFGVRGGGTLATFEGAVNGFYDFNVGSPIVPFVGLGVGYGETMLNSYKLYTPGSTTLYTPNSSAKGGIMGNAFLGAAYNIPGVPGLALTAEYRFSGLFQSTTFSGPVRSAGLPNVGNGTLKLGDQYNNGIYVGLRYAFNAPAHVMAETVVAPAPAPAPARSYLVFFDWDKYDLSARAKQIIAEAAQNSTRVAATRIEVNGHADTSGTAAYNMGLSLRRANTVAAELVKDGVSKAEISIKAFGDTVNLVPTGPGVREPQNRRVEIVLK